MMCRFALLLVAALLCLPGSGDAWLAQKPSTVDTGKQLLLSNSGGALTGTADRYIPLGTTGNGTSAFKSMTFPVAGAIKSLKLDASPQPASTATWTVTVYINGSSTSTTCTVTSSIQTCDWTGSVSNSAGDYAVILVHPANSPTSAIIRVSVGWTPSTTADRIILASPGTNTFSNSATNVIQGFDSGFAGAPAGINTQRRTAVLPEGGTIDKLFINSVAPGTLGSGKQYAYSLLVNGSAGGSPGNVAATISETATSASDTADSVSGSAGDYVNFQAVPSSTPTASDAGFGARYLASSTGRYPYISSVIAPNTGAARYVQIAGGVANATEANVQGITHSQTFEKLQCKTTVAPGTAASGKKWTCSARVGGSDVLSCDILETATTCSASGTVAVNDNSLVNYAIVPTNTPAAGAFIGISLSATR